MATTAAPSRSTAASLRLSGLRKSYGRVPAVRGVSLDVAPGTMTSLIGPSGCGKTTTLRMIAGLEQADEGLIQAGDRVLTDGRRAVPPERRDMGMVFQTYALWPHMTVADNVAYGLKRRGFARARIGAKVESVLATVGMGALGGRYPGQLSGGQQQRVALARSIATEPSILLFDEPLSNLDAVLREQMRFEIRSLQQRIGITAVYVTHSQDEALVLSDQIAVMQDGVIVQVGAPLDIYNVPRTEFVATFIGLANILDIDGTAREAGGLRGRLANGQTVLAATGSVEALSRPERARCRLSVRPVDMRLASPGRAQDPGANDVNQLSGRVATMTFTGGLVDYFVILDGAPEIRVRIQGTPPSVAEPGQRVQVEFAADRVVVLDD